jgi:4-hydroxybenzoate polyprenyltransferase
LSPCCGWAHSRRCPDHRPFLFTAFAAYTAIYALNDLVGIAVDKEKFAGGINAGYSVEASDLRYPLAQNALSLSQGRALVCGLDCSSR